jgi:hypothetical protein
MRETAHTTEELQAAEWSMLLSEVFFFSEELYPLLKTLLACVNIVSLIHARVDTLSSYKEVIR